MSVCDTFLAEFKKDCGSCAVDTSQEERPPALTALPPALVDATLRVKRVCQAFRCLLSPAHSDDAPALSQLLKPKSWPHSLESLSTALLKNDYYTKLWNEVLSKHCQGGTKD